MRFQRTCLTKRTVGLRFRGAESFRSDTAAGAVLLMKYPLLRQLTHVSAIVRRDESHSCSSRRQDRTLFHLNQAFQLDPLRIVSICGLRGAARLVLSIRLRMSGCRIGFDASRGGAVISPPDPRSLSGKRAHCRAAERGLRGLNLASAYLGTVLSKPGIKAAWPTHLRASASQMKAAQPQLVPVAT